MLSTSSRPDKVQTSIMIFIADSYASLGFLRSLSVFFHGVHSQTSLNTKLRPMNDFCQVKVTTKLWPATWDMTDFRLWQERWSNLQTPVQSFAAGYTTVPPLLNMTCLSEKEETPSPQSWYWNIQRQFMKSQVEWKQRRRAQKMMEGTRSWNSFKSIHSFKCFKNRK